MTQTRRDFLKQAGAAGAAAAGAAAANRGSAAEARAAAQPASGPAVRTVRTAVLEIGYEEHGDSGGFPIILLHGFPYDIRSWDGVAPPLAEAGYRVLVPYLRGYGSTRFLDPEAPRMAEQAAIAQDVVDFADALDNVHDPMHVFYPIEHELQRMAHHARFDDVGFATHAPHDTPTQRASVIAFNLH